MKELLSPEYLQKIENLAKEKAEEYANAKPFPHIYFDNFLPIEAAEAALAAFPEPKQLAWSEFSTATERKLAFDDVEKLPAPVRDVLYFLNSRPMLKFLEVLTGIKNVISDPYYVGGGLHQIKRGGNLEVHADFNFHTQLKLDRRINVLIYLNKDWKEEYGGHFELWNKEMTHADQKILPLFNRCAIFSTTSTSYHGHPTPLNCPPEQDSQIDRHVLLLQRPSRGRSWRRTLDAVHGTARNQAAIPGCGEEGFPRHYASDSRRHYQEGS